MNSPNTEFSCLFVTDMTLLMSRTAPIEEAMPIAI